MSRHLAATLALAGTFALAPRIADACGGFFCDSGPQVMPVDQTGETIIFWIDESGSEPHTEAHIQIQYEGDADKFAWIVPVTSVPEVSVGSQALFDNTLAATVPTFTINSTTIGDCSGSFGIGCAKAEFADGGDSGFFGESGDPTEGPEILDRGFAGAFEYVTLTGGNVDEIVEWLDANGYAQDDEAPPILAEYLQEGFVFVAIKLRSGAGIDEIHPLTIRYAGTEPCIPIRLTRIAAVDDMKIRALFLGDDRVGPQNWPHVEINHSRYDWVNGPATNYDEVVGLAIDEAGGRAWVTEYAGTDALVSIAGIHDTQWNALAFEGIAPEQTVDVLTEQGLLACDGVDCTFAHPQVRPLLEKYLPVPANVSEGAFWSCLSCYADLIDPVAWGQQPGFAADFAERISIPGAHAAAMLTDADYLTRLFTMLSPHEMLEDPLFHLTDGLPTVDNNIVATRVNDCDGGPTYFELPDGQKVAVDEGGAMPDIDGNPAALRIEQVPMMGPPQVEQDNAAEIDALLAAYNDTRLTGPSSGCSIGRFGLQGVLELLAIFGIAYFNRGGRRRTKE
jgi:hypothetical protein